MEREGIGNVAIPLCVEPRANLARSCLVRKENRLTAKRNRAKVKYKQYYNDVCNHL